MHPALRVYTVGHSTRTQKQLIELLQHYGVDVLLDIRSIPYSRYNPQFNTNNMTQGMESAGIAYEHVESLGGKKPPRDVIQRARSCSERSHGFAEYMKTDEFSEGLQHVIDLAGEHTVALMCAEADPSHCHRFWVADALIGRDVDVQHLVNIGDVREHPRNLFTY
jgi:uncharacterized protein (DUF488 family)